MISDDGNEVLIDGFDEDIKELDEPFLDLVDKLAQDFNVEGYKEGLGVQNLIGKDEKPRDVLERLFSTAQINIDGIWGGYTGPGAEAVIPPKAHAKLEVRLIPNQQSDKVIQCMEDHLTHHGYSDITIEKLAGVEYCLSSIEERIAQSLINAYRDIGAEAQIWPSSIATIPIYLFNREPLGIPFATGCVGYGGHSHGPDEYAVIEGKGKIEGLAGYEKLISSVILEYAR
ncbi:MAG: peptidase dimerization domain-containing protein [Promethearchaeati archaeon]